MAGEERNPAWELRLRASNPISQGITKNFWQSRHSRPFPVAVARLEAALRG